MPGLRDRFGLALGLAAPLPAGLAGLLLGGPGLALRLGLLALLPVTAYYLLPYAYAMLWLWARRRWLVEVEPRRPGG